MNINESDGGQLAIALVGLLIAAFVVSWLTKKAYLWLKRPRRQRVRLTLRERGMTQKQARQEFINQMAGGVFNDALEDMAVCGLLEKDEFLHMQEKLGRTFGLWEFAPKGLKEQKELKEILKAKREPKERLTGIAALRAAIANKRVQPA